LSPFQNTLGVQSGIESLGQNALTLGSQLGGNAATAGANAGRFLYGGGVGAAETMQGANAYNPLATGLINASTNPQLGQGLANWFGGGTPNLNGAGGGITNAAMLSPTYVPYGGGQALPLGYANL
jgi:hypothetical protein